MQRGLRAALVDQRVEGDRSSAGPFARSHAVDSRCGTDAQAEHSRRRLLAMARWPRDTAARTGKIIGRKYGAVGMAGVSRGPYRG
jgi:hypothetical protein